MELALEQKQLPPDIASAVTKVLEALGRTEWLTIEGPREVSHLLHAKTRVQIALEHDAELDSWEYAVVTLKFAASPQVVAELREREESLILRLYQGLTPEEATKMLLDFGYEHV